MIKTIYAKLVLIFVGIFILGNIVSFTITSITTGESLMGELTDSLTGVLTTVKDVYENGETTAEEIEKLYTSGFISVKFYADPAKLSENYGISRDTLLSIDAEPLVFKGREIEKHQIAISVVKSGESYIVAAPEVNNIAFDFYTVIFRANILSLIFGSVLMLVIARFIVKPVKKLSTATERIARGDFEVYIEKNRKDEIGQLIDNFNIMTKELAGMELLRNNFISDISHEFKTPLTSIEGYTKLLRNCKNTEERNEYIDIITEETKRLSTLSGNILLLNRIENENITLTKNTFHLDEQIRRAILLYENKWSSKDIDLQLELDKISYEGNEQLLYQVWLNLLDNAVKFSKPGGIVEISLIEAEGKTVFSITDYGKGMTVEEQYRMFEKFYTGDKSRNAEGTGLGLSIVKRIVDKHDGKIDVLTKPNEFTRIKILL